MKNNFNYIAECYDFLSKLIFRNSLQKSQSGFITQIPNGSTVLILGGGTGLFLHDLMSARENLKITYIDKSRKMANLARKRIKERKFSSEVIFLEIPIEEFETHLKYDVVVTNYFLDLFKEENLKCIMQKVSNMLHHEGIWIMTDFRFGNSLNKLWQIPLIRLMYAFFKFTANIENNKLLCFDRFFEELNFEKVVSKKFFSGMMEAVVYKRNS